MHNVIHLRTNCGKKILVIIAATILFLLAFSCGDSNKYSGIELNKDWKFQYQRYLEHIVLNDDLYLKSPSEIILFGNYLIVYDPENPEWVFHVFDKTTGEEKAIFGQKGKGPGELVKPSNGKNQFLHDRNSLMIYDSGSGKIIHYFLNDSLFDKKPNFKEQKKCDDCPLFKIFRIKKNYLSLNHYKSESKDRFTVYDTLFNELNTYVEFPEYNQSDLQNHERIRLTSFERISVKPDLTKMVFGTHIGTYLEILNIDEVANSIKVQSVFKSNIELGKIKNLGILPFSKKISIPIPDRDGIVGFKDIYSTDSLIYTIHSNRLWDDIYKGIDIIKVFDWNGKPVKKYHTDENLSCIAVDEKLKHIYAIGSDSLKNMQLIKFVYP